MRKHRSHDGSAHDANADALGLVLELGHVLLGQDGEERSQLVDVDGHLGARG